MRRNVVFIGRKRSIEKLHYYANKLKQMMKQNHTSTKLHFFKLNLFFEVVPQLLILAAAF